MKASEFVKKHGLEKAKECIEFGRKYKEPDLVQRREELKRLVESHGVIEACGGIHMARADVMDLDGFEKTSPHWMKIKQAILDVESCQ